MKNIQISNIYFKHFCNDESGAVTVDWVVLTAAVIGLGVAVVTTVADGTMSLANLTSTSLETTIQSNQTFEEILAAYVPLYPDHEGSDDWATERYAELSAFSDADLMSRYNWHYETATTSEGDEGKYTDVIMISEKILHERGIEIPEGNSTAAELYVINS